MAFQETVTLGQVASLTHRFILPKVADNVYKVSPIIARMSRPGQFKSVDGGRNLNAPIIKSKPTEGAYFTDLDQLSTDRTDNITTAQYDWKQLQEPIRVSQLEMIQNSGRAQVINLLTAKGQIAQKNIVENLSLGLFSDGSADTGAKSDLQLTGLQLLMDQTSSRTYGGIAEDDLADWVAQFSDISGNISLSAMQKVWGLCADGNEIPTVLIMQQPVMDQVWSLYQPHQRLVSEEMSALGFKNILTFNGAPMIVDSHIESGSIYYLNEEYVFLAIHPRENMRRETLDVLETSASSLSRIFWAGNLMCNNRRRNGHLDGITTA